MVKAGKAYSTRLPILKNFVWKSEPEFKPSSDFSLILTLKLHLVSKLYATYLFTVLVKKDFRTLFSLLLSSELRVE